MISTSVLKNSDKVEFAKAIKQKAQQCNVFMCIGTQKVIADSLGPRVGQILNENMKTPLFVYGLDSLNITAENLVDSYNFIKQMHPDEQIMVIDAGVGEDEQVGEVQLVNNGIAPGAATDKNLPMVGDISIVGIVAEKTLNDFYVTSEDKACLVNKLANFIADSILLSKQ